MPTDFAMAGLDGGEALISLMLRAPLIGLDATDAHLLHAVDMGGVASAIKGDLATVCGAATRGLIPFREYPEIAAPWPPRVAGMAPMVRCRNCYQACKVKRPRSEIGEPHG